MAEPTHGTVILTTTDAEFNRMLINFAGKILFPKQAEWQRRRQIKTIIFVVMSSLIFGSITGVLLLYAAGKR